MLQRNDEGLPSNPDGNTTAEADNNPNTKKGISVGHANFMNIMSAKERENDSWKKQLDICDFKNIRTTLRLDPDVKMHEKDWELLYNQHCHKNSYRNYYPNIMKEATQQRFEDDLKDIDKYRKLIENEQKFQFYDDSKFSTTYHIDQVLSWTSDEDIRTLTKLWFHQAIQGAAIFFPTNRTELFLYQIRQSFPYKLFVDCSVIYLLLSPTIMPHQCLEDERNRESTLITASFFIIICCLIQFLDVYIGYRTTHWTRMKDEDVNNSRVFNKIFPYSPSNHIQFDHNLNWQRVRVATSFIIILNSIAHLGSRDIPNLCRIATPILLIARREDLKQLLHGMYYASKKVSRLIRLAVIFVFSWAFLGFCFLRRYSVGSVSDEVRFSTFSQALYACVHCMLSRPTVLYRLKPIFVENNYSSFYFVILTLLGDIMLTTIIISMGTRAFRKFSLQNMEGRLKYRHVALHSLFRLYTKRYPADSKYNRMTLVSTGGGDKNVQGGQLLSVHEVASERTEHATIGKGISTLDSIKDKYYVDYAMNRHCWLTFVDNLDEAYKVSPIKNSILLFYLEACRKENSMMANVDVTESDVGGLIFEKSFFRLCGLISCRLKFFTDALFLSSQKQHSAKMGVASTRLPADHDQFKPRLSEDSHKSNNTISWCFVASSKVLHNWYKAIRYHPEVMAYQEAFQQRVFNAYHYVIIFYYPSWCDWFVETWLIPLVKFFFYQSKPQVKGEWRLRVFHLFQFTLYFLSILQTCLLANAEVATGVVVFQWFILLFFLIENQILSNVRIDISLFEVRATAIINFSSFVALCALSASMDSTNVSNSYKNLNDDALTALLIIESVRYIKVIISSKPFQSVASIIPVIGRAVFLYVMILYSFALLGHITLCQKMNTSDISPNADDDSPGWVPFAQFLNFNSIYASYYTVAASAVLSNWSMIMDAAVASTNSPQQSWVYIYFYFMRFCTVVIVIPLLLSCVIQAFIQFLDKRAADKQALLHHEKEQNKSKPDRMSMRKSASVTTGERISSLLHQMGDGNDGEASQSFAVSESGEVLPRRSLSVAFGRDIFSNSKRSRTKEALLAKDDDGDDSGKVQVENEWSDIRMTTSEIPNESSENRVSVQSLHSVASSMVGTKPKRFMTRTSILGLDYYHLTSLFSHNNLDIEDPIAALWSPNGRASVQYNQVRSPLEARYADLSMISASRHHERLDKILDHIESKLFNFEALVHSKLEKLHGSVAHNNTLSDINKENTSNGFSRKERFEVHDSLVIEKLKTWMKDFKEFDKPQNVENDDSEEPLLEQLTRDKLRKDLLKQVQVGMPQSAYPVLASNWFMETINGRRLYYPTNSAQLSHLLVLRSSWFMILLGIVVVFQMFAVFLVVPKCTIKTVDDPSQSTISHQQLNIIDICCCIVYLSEVYLDGFTNYHTYQHMVHSLSKVDEYDGKQVPKNNNSMFHSMKQIAYKVMVIARHGLMLRIIVVALILLKSIYSIKNPDAKLSNIRLIRGVFPYLVLSHYPHFSDILFGLRTSLYRSRMVYILFGSIVILFSIIGYFQFHRYSTHAGRFDQLNTAFLTILQCSTSAPFSLYVVLPYFDTVSQLTPLFFLTLTYITEVLCISLIVGAGNVYFSKYGTTALARRRKSRYQSLMQIFNLLATCDKGEAVPMETFKQFVKELPEKYHIPENEIPRLLAYIRRVHCPVANSLVSKSAASEFSDKLTRAEFYCLAGCVYRGITLVKVVPGESFDTLYNGMVNFDHGYYFGKESIVSISEVQMNNNPVIRNHDSPPKTLFARYTDGNNGIELASISSPLHQTQQHRHDSDEDEIGNTIAEEDERHVRRTTSMIKKEEEYISKDSMVSINEMDNISLSSATFVHEGKSLFTAEQEDVYILVIKDDNRTSYFTEWLPPNATTQYECLQTIINTCHNLVYTTIHIFSKPPITLTITLIDIYGLSINLLLLLQLMYYTSLKYCSHAWAGFGYFLECCILIELIIRMIGTGDRHFFMYQSLHSLRFYLAIFIVGCMIALGNGYMDSSRNVRTSYLMLVVSQCFNIILACITIRPHSHNALLLEKDTMVIPVTAPAAVNAAAASQTAGLAVIRHPNQEPNHSANSSVANNSSTTAPSSTIVRPTLSMEGRQRRIDYSATMQIYHNHYIRSGISNSVSNRRFKLSIENTCRSLLLLLIILYFYTILAQDSFCGVLNPNEVVGSPTNDDDASGWNNFSNILNFNNYPQTLFTLFEVTVLGSWSMVMDAVLYNYPRHEFSVYAFFFAFRLSMTLIFLPLLMSFMVRSFISLHDQISFIHKRRKKFLQLAKKQKTENELVERERLSRLTVSPLDQNNGTNGGRSMSEVSSLYPASMTRNTLTNNETNKPRTISEWCQAAYEGKFLHYYPPAVIKYQTFAPYLDIWDTTALHDSDIITVQDPVFTKTLLAVENAGWKLKQYLSFLKEADIEKCFDGEDIHLLVELKQLMKDTEVVLKECDELSSLLT